MLRVLTVAEPEINLYGYTPSKAAGYIFSIVFALTTREFRDFINDACSYVTLTSNEPAEDEHQEVVVPVPSGYWSFFGLFDGHNGGDTSKWLASNLVPAVCGALADLYSKFATSAPVPGVVV